MSVNIASKYYLFALLIDVLHIDRAKNHCNVRIMHTHSGSNKNLTRFCDLCARRNIRVENAGAVFYEFLQAVAMGDLPRVQELAPQVNLSAYNNAALYLAVCNGHLPVLQFLHQNRVDIRYWDDVAVRWAAENGHVDILRYLQENGLDLHDEDNLALIFAGRNGHLPAFKYLHEQGGNIRADDDLAARLATADLQIHIVHYILRHICDEVLCRHFDFSKWADNHFVQFFATPFVLRHPMRCMTVWNALPEQNKTAQLRHHYQRRISPAILARVNRSATSPA